MPNHIDSGYRSKSMPTLDLVSAPAFTMNQAMMALRDSKRVTAQQLRDGLSAVRSCCIDNQPLLTADRRTMLEGLARGYDVLQEQNSQKLTKKLRALDHITTTATRLLQRDLKGAEERFQGLTQLCYARGKELRYVNDICKSNDSAISALDDATWLKLRKVPIPTLHDALIAWERQDAGVFSREEALRRFPANPPGVWCDVMEPAEDGGQPVRRSLFITLTSETAERWMELGFAVAERRHLTNLSTHYAVRCCALRRELDAFGNQLGLNAALQDCNRLRAELIDLTKFEARLRPEKFPSAYLFHDAIPDSSERVLRRA